MVSHHLREVRDLCDYRVTGVGTSVSDLAGLVFDAADWKVRSFIIRQGTSASDVIALPRSCFHAIDDAARELELEIPDAMSEPLQLFRPATLEGSTLFEATSLIGQSVLGADAPAGEVTDLLVNVDIWQMRYLVIATRAGHVLTDIEWASSLADGGDELRLDLPAEAVATAPSYGSLDELCSGYEEDLYRHYTRSEFVGWAASG